MCETPLPYRLLWRSHEQVYLSAVKTEVKSLEQDLLQEILRVKLVKPRTLHCPSDRPSAGFLCATKRRVELEICIECAIHHLCE
jgi:hypothetical protein